MPHPADRCRNCGDAWHRHCPCLDGGRCHGDRYCHNWAYWVDRPGGRCLAPGTGGRWVDECPACVCHGQCRMVCLHAAKGPCTDLVGDGDRA